MSPTHDVIRFRPTSSPPLKCAFGLVRTPGIPHPAKYQVHLSSLDLDNTTGWLGATRPADRHHGQILNGRTMYREGASVEYKRPESYVGATPNSPFQQNDPTLPDAQRSIPGKSLDGLKRLGTTVTIN